jgi:hypothetical protein
MHWREGIKKVSLWEAAVREAKGRLEKNPSGFFDLAAVSKNSEEFLSSPHLAGLDGSISKNSDDLFSYPYFSCTVTPYTFSTVSAWTKKQSSTVICPEATRWFVNRGTDLGPITAPGREFSSI